MEWPFRLGTAFMGGRRRGLRELHGSLFYSRGSGQTRVQRATPSRSSLSSVQPRLSSLERQPHLTPAKSAAVCAFLPPVIRPFCRGVAAAAESGTPIAFVRLGAKKDPVWAFFSTTNTSKRVMCTFCSSTLYANPTLLK